MNSKTALIAAATFLLGIAIGYLVPRGEDADAKRTDSDRLEPISIDTGNEPARRADTAAPRSRGNGTAREQQPRIESEDAVERESGDAGIPVCHLVEGFDAVGKPTESWPAVSLGAGRFLVPARAFVAVTRAVIRPPGGSPERVRMIEGLGDLGQWLVINTSLAADAAPRRDEPIESGADLWLLAPDDGERRARPTLAAGHVFDPDARLDLLELEGRFELPKGGLVLDGANLVVGVALPSPDPGRVRVLEVAGVDLTRLRIVEQRVAEYYKAHFEGSVEALLRTARGALERRRFAAAVEAFSQALAREPGLLATIRAEFLAAIEGQLATLSAVTQPRRRFSFLRGVVQDLTDEAGLWIELARAARAVREYEEALAAWDRAWSLSPDKVADLDSAKDEVFHAWAKRLVEEGRIRDALDVLDRAIATTGGSVEIWLLKGKLELRRRDYLEAARAMREALALDPRLAAQLDEAIARAERLAEGPGRVVIDYPPGARSILATVELNGIPGEFIVDTGATSSMVPVGLARRAGLDLSDRVPKVKLHTAGDTRIVPYSPVESLRMGELVVTGISVVVGNLSGNSDQGLLGMDFLGRFHIENDSQNGRLVLSERR